MFAYVVKAIYPRVDDSILTMLVYHEGSKGEVHKLVTGDGWQVKRVSTATMEDIRDFERFEDLRIKVRDAAKKRQLEAAERERIAKIDQEQRERKRREREMAENRAAEERRDRAIVKATGDLFQIDIEPELHGNKRIAALCAKTLLFFDQASVNKRDLFTSISVDFADFQSFHDYERANRLISILISDLNDWLKIEDGISQLQLNIHHDRVSTENEVNSIASRSHVYGGSGLGLLLSAMDAERAAKQDQKTIDHLKSQHFYRARQVMQATEEAQMRQNLIECRAKTAVSILCVACGKSNTIEVNLPLGVEQFVLGS